jgi:hypothetical protein
VKKRSILLAIVGAAGAAAALAKAPGLSDWIARTVLHRGGETPLDPVPAEPVAADADADPTEPVTANGDLRLSLRARLAESAAGEVAAPAAAVAAANAEAATDAVIVDRPEEDPVDAARARVRAKARAARARLSEAPADLDVDD